jgi:hypothetical protein
VLQTPFTDALHDGVDVYARVPARQNYVAATPLRRSETREVDHRLGHCVAARPQPPDGGVDDLLDVVLHRGHILDENDLWLQHLGCPCHARVQGVSWIGAPRVVVQVRMPLTGRAPDNDIDSPHVLLDLGLGLGRRLSMSVKQPFDVITPNCCSG